jgi:ABC-type dipeptide/oligopeptide/nickel transport system permease component
VDLDFVEDHLAGGPFEVVLTLIALLVAWLLSIWLGSAIGMRLGQAWAGVFGTPHWVVMRGQTMPAFGSELGVLTVSLLYIGVVIGAII